VCEGELVVTGKVRERYYVEGIFMMKSYAYIKYNNETSCKCCSGEEGSQSRQMVGEI
jgi:hypothetical protein